MAQTLLFLTFVVVFAVLPISGQPREDSDPIVDRSGILTDRLSERQLKIWRKIEQIVLTEDVPGRPIYPTLRRLWDTVQKSGHRVYIELRSRKVNFLRRRGIFRVSDGWCSEDGAFRVVYDAAEAWAPAAGVAVRANLPLGARMSADR